MLNKIICFIFGHKFKAKAFTGKTMTVTNYLGTPMVVSLYKWKFFDYCLRCGKSNKKD